jgi:hypothetical protein
MNASQQCPWPGEGRHIYQEKSFPHQHQPLLHPNHVYYMDLLRTYFPIFTPDILPVSPGILRLLSKAPSSAWCTVLCLLFFSYILGHFKDHQNQVSSTHVDGLSWGCETGSCEQGGHRCQGKNHLRILMSSQFPVSLREDWLSVFSLITKN